MENPRISEQASSSPFLSELEDGDTFDGFYVIKEASFQTAVNGKNYIRMTLGDASGTLSANIWDATREIYQLCPAGEPAKIQGVAESYKGKTQIRIIRIRPAHESEVDLTRFLPRSRRPEAEMREELLARVASLKDRDYKAAGEAFFHDAALMDRFARLPAAREVHHARLGGLLEHTLGVARLAEEFSRDGRVNRDLLLLGALLHDVGKVEELTARFAIEYSDRGKLLGHLYIGAEMAAERCRALPAFPAGKLALIQHLILSHHGKFEFGSPVLPKIPEAFALHHLDNLDAKVDTANRLLSEINDPEKNWTDYCRPLETSLYRDPEGPAPEA